MAGRRAEQCGELRGWMVTVGSGSGGVYDHHCRQWKVQIRLHARMRKHTHTHTHTGLAYSWRAHRAAGAAPRYSCSKGCPPPPPAPRPAAAARPPPIRRPHRRRPAPATRPASPRAPGGGAGRGRGAGWGWGARRGGGAGGAGGRGCLSGRWRRSLCPQDPADADENTEVQPVASRGLPLFQLARGSWEGSWEARQLRLTRGWTSRPRGSGPPAAIAARRPPWHRAPPAWGSIFA